MLPIGYKRYHVDEALSDEGHQDLLKSEANPLVPCLGEKKWENSRNGIMMKSRLTCGSLKKMIHEELWASLRKRDPLEVCRCSMAHFDTKSKNYSLKILDREYLIFPNEQIMRTEEESSLHPPGFYLQLSAVNYLIGAKDVPLKGVWVNAKQFPSGSLFLGGPHMMPSRDLAKSFGQDEERFVLASRACGGFRVEGGDTAFEFSVFPRLPVRLILWLADEEFPARAMFLFDQTANIHLKLDALWAVGKLIEKTLIEAF